MNIDEIYDQCASEVTEDEYRAISKAVRLAVLQCAETVCNLCLMYRTETTPGEDIKSVGHPHRLDNWLTYKHSIEYRDGRQYYWECEAGKMWEMLE